MTFPAYDHAKIEARWQAFWEEQEVAYVNTEKGDHKYYMLMMYPYPSGDLHVGHGRNYILGDAVYRYYRMRGRRALNPMGWDAFGLPAENAALKHGIHPREWTLKNIQRMKEQFRRWGVLYDWSKEITTCNPDYYRWNQWLFIQMFKRGLAYRAKGYVNWCPHCQTVLANEQVQNGRCERCEEEVESRQLEQWFFKITDYAERLLKGLDHLYEWPDQVILQQRNWIGRSEGTDIIFHLPELNEKITVFTTRPDTLFGVTFLALAPEHPLASQLVPDHQKAKWQKLQRRSIGDTTKEGFKVPFEAVHPLTGENLPIYIANFVVMDYGTGAVMGVPAHDQRDFEFAKENGLPIREVIHHPQGFDGTQAYTGPGKLIHSDLFSDMDNEKAIHAITNHLEKIGKGKATVRYRLRDWLISRQRYWGTPIPMVYCDTCGIVPEKEENLPVTLPHVDFSPTLQGNPLATVESFVSSSCPSCGQPARRETDTMDTFVDSSWYYCRYLSPQESHRIFDVPRAKKWLPVDLYIGGIEHAILHLLYARFICRVLYDLDLVATEEPFQRLFTQGMICKQSKITGKLEKMSKSKGNVVSPDEIIEKYGADTERLYTLFIGPPHKDAEWNDRGVPGSYRFLKKFWRVAHQVLDDLDKTSTPHPLDRALERKLHQTIKQVTQDYERFHFNTAIARLMEALDELVKARSKHHTNLALQKEFVTTLCKLLYPLAPHITEELAPSFGLPNPLLDASWPEYDPKKALEEVVTVVIQINGKVRDQIEVPRDASQEAVEMAAWKTSNARRYLGGKEPKKVIYIPNRLINFVIS